ncbi:MAG: ATP synthase subunit I [Burkholderiales bacterium]|nr:ATP synthase subunit I [Burkholderiales bacterium]
MLWWQVYATAASALAAGLWAGYHGALSALLGGLITLIAGAVSAWIGARSGNRTAGEILWALFRAETSKIVLIVVQLWLVLAYYKQVSLAAFFGTFVLTLILFSMAFFVRER